MAGSGPLDSFGTILSGLAKRLGLESHLVELRLQQHWREIVGEPIASHTWPAQLRAKKLYLIVPNSVWLQQLTFLKPTLLAKLNAEAGTELVTDIVLRLGEIPAPATDSSGASTANEPSPVPGVSKAEAASHTAVIQDPDIRQRFTEVISTYPSRTPSPPEADRLRVP